MRDEKVILDLDLAKLCNVKTKHFKEAVRRNIDNFPDDFMFVLKSEEFENEFLNFYFADSNYIIISRRLIY